MSHTKNAALKLPKMSLTQRTLPYYKYYGKVIYYHRSNLLFVEISCEFSPGKQGVSETLP